VGASRTSVAVAIAGLALLVPGPAAAQNGGVYVDPDSPTGKQYQLPLESARRQADPSSDGRLAPPGARASGTGAAALFGEGITKASAAGKRSSSGGSGGKSTPGGRGGGSDGSSSSRKTDSASSNTVRAAVSNPGAPSTGIGSTLLVGAGAALVLLAGGLAGFVVRRRSTD
jgi:LPXTG-motif cell wall-anchored protein